MRDPEEVVADYWTMIVAGVGVVIWLATARFRGQANTLAIEREREDRKAEDRALRIEMKEMEARINTQLVRDTERIEARLATIDGNLLKLLEQGGTRQ